MADWHQFMDLYTTAGSMKGVWITGKLADKLLLGNSVWDPNAITQSIRITESH